jgi:hypothetical protein
LERGQYAPEGNVEPKFYFRQKIDIERHVAFSNPAKGFVRGGGNTAGRFAGRY